ncbi:RNA-directed DNA polymerase [Vibrio parahaemolyticus]|nr:RNA-directed DNA polymerase [Vibrio parahaemolyticus]MDF4809611.1 RNA-directed DNA polymerase [Vibrio parahaemolyticus]MDF4853760.1 RNA-directed DNA polymerase [Vibrio parahaemolyticus]HCG8031789.1 RNA-directed DNA polymerase [Vibrio parahaemolyticus]HCG8052492.1 RNA-directed DNA polymerase [Vibrio parahaemolyticus]
MLKQVFSREQLSKVVSPTDVRRWNLLSEFGDVDTALEQTIGYWEGSGLALSPINAKLINGKTVYTPSRVEDSFAIKLVDRFVRRIYKVRQSDRNRIVKQVITLLKDSGDYHVLRVDIKKCYESILFDNIISKLQNDLILSPECMNLLNDISRQLKDRFNFTGLPRGLSISPTLAELYLEDFDKKIAASNDVIYSARYVDDIILITTNNKKNIVIDFLVEILSEMGLKLNGDDNKNFSGSSINANFDYLGYSISVIPKKDKPNQVNVTISESKLKKLKSRIIISLHENSKNKDISLLKRRVEFLSLLKTVKKGKNGNLLAGIAHNYQYTTDNFECLKSIDGFFINQLQNPRFGLTLPEVNKIKSISFYGNAVKRNIGKFSRKKTTKIMQIWKDV